MIRRTVAPLDRLSRIVEATAVVVFLYQALRVLFSVLFGLIYDALFAETAGLAGVGLWLLAVILALLAPLAAPRRPHLRRIALLATAVLAFVARIALTFDHPQGRLVAAIVILAAAGVYLATLLRGEAQTAVRAILLALVVDQLCRAAGHTFDVTLRPGWWPLQALATLALCLLAAGLARQAASDQAAGSRPGLLSGLGWGAWLFLETSLFAFPNAVAHWTGVPYHVAAPLLLAATVLPLLEGGHWQALWGRPARIACALVLVGGLAVGSLAPGVLGFGGLLLAQVAAVTLLPAVLLPRSQGRDDRAGAAQTLGGILFLILSFVYAFTFTYAYTLDLFRGLGLPLFLLAALLAALPAVLRPAAAERPMLLLEWDWAVTLGFGLVILVAVWTWPKAVRPPAAGIPLRAATYNVHYGYDSTWHMSLAAQAETIEAAGANVVALQEVDTGRPTSYMVDDALWLAHRLGMQVVYLPCVEHLTGIAVLSRYPILDSEGLLLPSNLEQTGIIWAKLDVEGREVNAFATWMGLEPEERARQLDAALPFIASRPGPAAYGGDFNSTPDEAVYARIQAAGFVDPFPALGLGSPPTDPAINPHQRIDFVWLRDLTPTAALVLDSLASDHRMVVVEMGK